MTTGLVTAVANGWLNTMRGTTYTNPAGTYVKLHTGDPSAAGTANASAVTTRNAATFTAASAGALALSAISNYAMTATESISHISVWDASTAGNVLWTAALTTPKSVVNTDQLSFTGMTLSLAPVAV